MNPMDNYQHQNFDLGYNNYEQNDQTAEKAGPKAQLDTTLGLSKITENPDFTQKEHQYKEKIDEFIGKTPGKEILTKTDFFTFLGNKILFCTTVFEFLLQRSDYLTLFLCLFIFFLEIQKADKKYLYKILFLLIISIIFDAFHFLNMLQYLTDDPSTVEASAGGTMKKIGILIILANIAIKLVVAYGVWKNAIEYKNSGDKILDDQFNNARDPEENYRARRPDDANDYRQRTNKIRPDSDGSNF